MQQELDLSHKEMTKRANESADKSENIKKLENRQSKFEQEVGALKDQINKLNEQKDWTDAKLKVNLVIINENELKLFLFS